MRGPWSRKTPRRLSITPVVDRLAVGQFRKAKRLSIQPTSEKNTIATGE